MSTDMARKCFVENRNLFGNATTQPEKYNLYNGLTCLAEAVAALQHDIETLKHDVDRINMKLR